MVCDGPNDRRQPEHMRIVVQVLRNNAETGVIRLQNDGRSKGALLECREPRGVAPQHECGRTYDLEQRFHPRGNSAHTR
jgi:hypothetical protein